MTARWTRKRSRGSLALMRLMVWIALRLGRWPARLILHGITTYFLLFSLEGRRASRAYLARVLDRRPGLGDIYRHYFTFACTLLDRVYLLAGRGDVLSVDFHGRDLLPRSGCLLIGAHLGSFDVMRVLAEHDPNVDVRVLMHLRPDSKIERIFDELNPALKEGVIPIGGIATMLRLKEAVEGGAQVALLADRFVAEDRSVSCRFLGETVSLPAGPFHVAATLGVPMYTCFGLHRGWGRYQVVIEPFAEGIDADRTNRDEVVAQYAQAFADRLAYWCRQAPYNWFNFYDFWSDAPSK
ncbi:lipid A biosynthesis acyltransferase [Ectothiorhodospiraceae bacterium WFHF3C12]|nr:lipid A biosynthesis acyltransferase [Ectothiorhodospiraceae bacterium WFHF3C12]